MFLWGLLFSFQKHPELLTPQTLLFPPLCSCSDSTLLSSHPGGGSGIGRAVCQRLASEGASVVVADISEESANETLGSLQSDLRGQVHTAAVVDVSSKESIKKLVTSVQVRTTLLLCVRLFLLLLL